MLIRSQAMIILFFFFLLIGLFLRLFSITDNTFLFYDEGMWLQQGRVLFHYVQHEAPPLWTFLQFNFNVSLPTGKALWAFIANLRAYFLDEHAYYFVRVISAFCGLATLGVLYLFAKRFFNSSFYALMGSALLAIYPSHVFYSRSGLQEACSTFLFLSGMYLYVYRHSIVLRGFLSGILWAGVYFLNYRMIILPGLIFIVEWCLKGRLDYRRYVYSMLTFLAGVLWIGSLQNGANIQTTFGWMFHQSHLAGGGFSPGNILSYPYYLFKFEGFLFGALFCASGYLCVKRGRHQIYPFMLFLVCAGLFSFSQEQGVRYMTFLYPFMVLMVVGVFRALRNQENIPSLWVNGLIAVLFIHMSWLSCQAAIYRSSYQQVTRDILARDPSAKIVSTQPMIQKLFVPNPNHVKELRRGLPQLINLYQNGYAYLVMDPQAYISLTDSRTRFDLPLDSYLQFVFDTLTPLETYDHFKHSTFERFVWEHNENFLTTWRFLHEKTDAPRHVLKVYDLGHVLLTIRKVMTQYGV